MPETSWPTPRTTTSPDAGPGDVSSGSGTPDALADVASAWDRSAAPVAAARGWDHEADRWLVERAVAGHGQAFEVLLRRHQDRIYRIALRITGDPADAEDVTQDVAVQLWRALASFTGSSTFTTWLYRIVVNRGLNHRRARRVPGRDPGPLLDGDHPRTLGPAQRVEDAARLEAAARALDGLPADQRAALVLCRLEGLTYQDAAAVAGVTEGAMRSRLERGRRNLIAAMQEWT